jgi:hypothetical protein
MNGEVTTAPHDAREPETYGGLPINGYPIGDERAEVLEDGKAYTVQYFERARMEYHPENDDPHRVLLGQFGRRIHGGADAPVGPSGNGTYSYRAESLSDRSAWHSRWASARM